MAALNRPRHETITLHHNRHDLHIQINHQRTNRNSVHLTVTPTDSSTTTTTPESTTTVLGCSRWSGELAFLTPRGWEVDNATTTTITLDITTRAAASNAASSTATSSTAAPSTPSASIIRGRSRSYSRNSSRSRSRSCRRVLCGGRLSVHTLTLAASLSSMHTQWCAHM